MNIGIDFSAINNSKDHGIGKYAQMFSKTLIDNYSEHNYYFLNWSYKSVCNELFADNLQYTEKCVGKCTKDDVSKAKNIIKNFVEENNIELFLDMSPLWGDRPTFSHEWFGETCRLVAVVYDFIPYVMRKSFYANNSKAMIEYIHKMFNLRQYDHLFPISHHTLSDAIRYIGITEERMTVIYCGVGEAPVPTASESQKEILKKFGLNRKYFLFSSGDSLHKNVSRLILAYIKAKKKNKTLPMLAITGLFAISNMNRFKRLLCEGNVEKDVSFLGYVSNKDISVLYDNAFWALYPSLYEGFGMPIVEAWKHECPVLTSNSSSMKEISDGCAVLVEPENIDDLAEGLLKITDISEEGRERYVSLGVNESKRYTWENCVKIFSNYLTQRSQDILTDVESHRIHEKSDQDINEEKKKWDQWLAPYEQVDSKDSFDNIKLQDPQPKPSYFDVGDKWMSLRDHGIKITKYFDDYNYKKIAIYGMGNLSNHLLAELKSSTVTVEYGIDRRAIQIFDVIPIKSVHEELTPVDAIVVTILHDYENIKRSLSKFVDCPIILISDIVDYIWDNLLRQHS